MGLKSQHWGNGGRKIRSLRPSLANQSLSVSKSIKNECWPMKCLAMIYKDYNLIFSLLMQWDLLSWKNLGSSTFPPLMWECVLVFLRIALLIPLPHRLTRWVTMVCCPEWGLGNRRRLMHLVVGVSWAWPLRWPPGSLSGHCRQGLCSNHCPVLPVRHRQQVAIPSQQLFLTLSLLLLSFPPPLLLFFLLLLLLLLFASFLPRVF